MNIVSGFFLNIFFYLMLCNVYAKAFISQNERFQIYIEKIRIKRKGSEYNKFEVKLQKHSWTVMHFIDDEMLYISVVVGYF